MKFEIPDLPQGLGVSRETTQRLEGLLKLVAKWNPSINLVARTTLDDGWNRHVVDSAQLWLQVPEAQGLWLDIGSGGGFPGLVVAILAKELSSNLRVALIESDQRKCVFLREAARQLGLDVDVRPMRIEAIAPAGARVVSARALSSLSDLLAHAHRHLTRDGVAVLLKGKSVEDEIAEARKTWRFEFSQSRSLTDPEGSVLKVWSIERG